MGQIYTRTLRKTLREHLIGKSVYLKGANLWNPNLERKGNKPILGCFKGNFLSIKVVEALAKRHYRTKATTQL